MSTSTRVHDDIILLQREKEERVTVKKLKPADLESPSLARTHTLEHDYFESKDGSAQRRFYVALHEDREFYQAKTVKTHSNHLVVLAHVQLKSFYRLSTCDITHVRKCTRPSPTLPYYKGREGSGNKAKNLLHVLKVECTHTPSQFHNLRLHTALLSL